MRIVTASLFALTVAFDGCVTNYRLTREEHNILGEYGPSGAAFAGISFDLESDYSFVAKMWTDAGPRAKSYTGKWTLREDTLVLNSEPTPRHKNYSMTEHTVPNQSDIFIRVMNLDSTKALYERWMSKEALPSPHHFFKADLTLRDNKPAFVVISSAYGEYRFHITIPRANCFTTFVQVPEEVPEFIADMKFLVNRDGTLAGQLRDGRFSKFPLVRR